MNDDELDKYYRRVSQRSWIKAMVMGLIYAFAAMLITGVILFVTRSYGLFYIAFVVLVAVAGAAIPLLYFFRYRPTEKDVANAVDSLGMEERFVTMVELRGSKSYIAERQRSDTYSAAKTTPATAIRIAVSTALLILVIILGALAAGATVYNALADAGIAPGMDEISEAVGSGSETVLYTVTYEEYDGDTYDGYVVGGGVINGDRIQIVEDGGNCTTVYAEAMPDSEFYMWSDGSTNPERTDRNIKEDKEIYAIFLETDDPDGDEAGDEGKDGDSSARGDTDPNSEGSGSGGGDSDSDSGDPGDGAGGGNNMNNKVNDNNTNYEDEIGSATDEAGNDFNNGNYSDDEIEIGSGYFERLN
ncbi:MAG: hypothetical protein LUD72_03415 [Bacteroidales bacterium]|nr:hypothetical protein [Bacteroidales bacterium]